MIPKEQRAWVECCHATMTQICAKSFAVAAGVGVVGAKSAALPAEVLAAVVCTSNSQFDPDNTEERLAVGNGS